MEQEFNNLLSEYGYLCLAKEAEEISDDDFSKEAMNIKGGLKAVANAFTAKKFRRVGLGAVIKDSFKRGKVMGAAGHVPGSPEFNSAMDDLLKNQDRWTRNLKRTGLGIKEPAMAWGGTAAALGGGKYLYNKLKKDHE